jgi:hypothetical protein
MLWAHQEITMRIRLLALASAALLSGTIAASAQGTPSGGAPSDQNRNEHAQPAAQTPQPGQHPSAQPGMRGPSQTQPSSGQDRDLDRTQDRNLQHTQMQGGEQYQDRDRARNQPSGGEMLRGGEMREQGGHTLTVQQRTNLRETVLRGGPRVTHINFRIGVGAVVPRTVRLVTVSEPILAIYPEWSGDLYFAYGDEIVVVAPDTMQIVGVLPL